MKEDTDQRNGTRVAVSTSKSLNRHSTCSSPEKTYGWERERHTQGCKAIPFFRVGGGPAVGNVGGAADISTRC
jgi:hypothetical protein